MFPADCAGSEHCVSVLVHAPEVTLVESSEPVPPSLPSSPGSRQGGLWEGRTSCSHPTPSALDGEGALLIQRERQEQGRVS